MGVIGKKLQIDCAFVCPKKCQIKGRTDRGAITKACFLSLYM